MTGLTYPYTKYDRLLGDQLDLDLEFSPSPTPPAGTAGGAGKFKYWVDTSTPLPSLRQCVVSRATAGAYVAAEWITLGTIDAAGAFHFNTDDVDFTGGTGPLVVSNLSVVNATWLGGPVSTGGSVAIGGTLSVAGATSLHATGITGALDVAGDTGIVGALGVTGSIGGSSLVISGATILHDVVVTGALTTPSSGISISGPITSTGVNAGIIFYDRTLTTHSWTWFANNDVAYLYESPLNSSIISVNANGATTLNALVVTNASTLHATSITGNLSVSGTLGVVGLATAGSLAVTGAVTIAGALTVDGTVVMVGAATAASFGTTGNLTVGGTATVGSLTTAGTITASTLTVAGTATAGTFDGIVYSLRGRTFANTDSTFGLTGIYEPDGIVAIGIYATGAAGGPTAGDNFYRANSHNFHNRNDTLGYAVFNAAGTGNQTGSWLVISDDSVKENITSYSVGLAALLQLNPVSFNYFVPEADGTHWSPFADPRGTTTPTVHYGLMASQVQPVIPEMVHEATYSDIPQGIPETPLLTIAPTHLVYVLTNAAKELAGQTDTLFSQTQGLDAALNTHTQQIGDLDVRIGQVASGSQALFGQVRALDQRVTTLENTTGVVDGSEAPAGHIGEYKVVANTAGTQLSADTPTQICTLTLEPGDWEVWGSVDFTPPSNVSPNLIAASVSIHPDALPNEDDLLTGVGILNMFATTALTSGQRQMLMTGQCRSNSNAPLDLYLIGQTSFTGSATVLTKGYICARRVR